MNVQAARERRKEVLDSELPKAAVLVRRTVGNAREGKYDAALSSTALKAIENVKDKVEATYHSECGLFRPEMYQIWRYLADLYSVKEIRKAIEVPSSLILSTPLLLY